MRIAAKLTLALIAAMAVVLVVHGVIHYRRINELHERETRDDLAILADAVANAAGSVWRNSGPEGARRYVQEADVRYPYTKITLRDGVMHASAKSSSAAAVVNTGEQLVATVPVVGSHGQPAFVELRRSLDHAEAYRAAIINSQVVTTAVLVFVSAALSMVLGLWLIGRPVRLLIEQTRRVARGEYDTGIELRQRDELGNLATELNSMTRQLVGARSQLRAQRRARAALQEQLRHADRLSTVGKVASGIAHELGTPLNVVAGRAAIIAGQTSDEEVASNAEIIAQQTRRMTDIIRELLDFSRRRGVQREDVRIDEILDQATTLLEPIAEDRGVSIVVEEVGELRADIDINKLLQVLTNLMMNAVQAMPDGGTLTIRARAEDVEHPRNDHAEPGAYVAVTVADEGAGIAEGDLEHIFQPFFTTKREGRGTGLGLYVCHGIVREQSGWMDVKSTLGKGSEFTVYLPQHDTPRSER